MNNWNGTLTGVDITGQDDPRLQIVLHHLNIDSPERRAIAAGEIDGVIDYEDKNILLFPLSKATIRKNPPLHSNPDPRGNGILGALPRDEYLKMSSFLEPVLLKFNELIQESGTPIRYVYFPIDCVISLLATVENRQILEVALVGFEGMVGTSLALEVNVSSVRARVGISGRAVRMSEKHFRDMYWQNPVLRKELSRFVYTELTGARQTAACCAFHMIEQRFARRLLMIADRLQSDRYFCTHELAAYALGVRRESITKAASTFQNRGFIAYSRGHIRILNRRKLESVACSCYSRIETRSVQINSVISGGSSG